MLILTCSVGRPRSRSRPPPRKRRRKNEDEEENEDEVTLVIMRIAVRFSLGSILTGCLEAKYAGAHELRQPCAPGLWDGDRPAGVRKLNS